MAGGTFKLNQPKVRPGVYVNVLNGRQPNSNETFEGIGMLPFVGYDYGPRDTWIHLTAESPDAAKALFGRSVYDDNSFMRMIAMMLQNATEVYVMICNTGTKASASILTDKVTITAKYPGTRGNRIQVVSVANAVAGFDISIYMDGSEVERFEKVTTWEAIESEYIDIAVTDNQAVAAFASASLTTGSDNNTTSTFPGFLDKAEKIRFNCMAVPITDAASITAAISKIRYIRNSIGWKCTAVVANTAADSEGIYNLTNGIVYDGTNVEAAIATAWLAGAVAAADYTTSLTYKVVNNASAVYGEKTNEASAVAIQAGEIFFSVDELGNVIVEYDRNSKITFAAEDPVDIYKGRPLRVYDTLANELLVTFRPGTYDNSTTGWAVMEGLGRAILQAYQADGAIQNVDLEADFRIDQEMSSGESVYINIGVQPVDSAEKYYFTVVSK